MHRWINGSDSWYGIDEQIAKIDRRIAERMNGYLNAIDTDQEQIYFKDVKQLS